MSFSESEIEKCRELKRLGLHRLWHPAVGQFIVAKSPLEGTQGASEATAIIIDAEAVDRDAAIWLPTFDDLLQICRELKISFSQMTDYLHRRRFADQNEREGVYQLLIETLKSSLK